MKKLLRQLLLGNAVISEYSTVTVNEEINEKVYLQSGEVIIDISQNQFLLCLEPVIFGVWLEKSLIKDNGEYKMYFKIHHGRKNNEEKTLAIIDLVLFDKIESESRILFLLKLESTKSITQILLKPTYYITGFTKSPDFLLIN